MPDGDAFDQDSAPVRLAAAALEEISLPGAVREFVDAANESDAVTVVRFASGMRGYPDWLWSVLVSRGVEGGPTVLEVALVPGESSLLAPAWVPWADRLADYVAAREGDDAGAAALPNEEFADDGDEEDDDDIAVVDDDDPFGADDGPDIDVEEAVGDEQDAE